MTGVAHPQVHPDRWQDLNALLEVALELPAHEVAGWLKALPQQQQSYVPVLTTLLARTSRETDTFLGRPLVLPLDEMDQLDAPPDQPGDEVGPYRLVRELGVGGMATVWLAERLDGMLDRQVALKLPRTGWALGLPQRMARERHILGALAHPCIARLYDAGVTSQGRPWLALEAVMGVPIDEYVRDTAMTVKQALALFLQVAQAVSHAHARLIVHRDLKPSNILVTAQGEVRLLDFGVATLLRQDTEAMQGLTQIIGRAVTPGYASPEQVSNGCVTVATDVYSLGVVLYELLTGAHPYQLAHQSPAALEDAVLHQDVPLASWRAAICPALARQLRGDLDAVLAKALQKSPLNRYTTVDAFADDVKRYIAGEPVHAQALSRRYRAGKFIGRHRTAVVAVAAVALSLVAGLGGALWQADLARQQAARAEQVKDFMASILRQAKPREGAGGVVTAVDLLTVAAQRIERDLTSDPRAAAELGVIIGESLHTLGDSPMAARALRVAVQRAEQAYGPHHRVTVHAKALLMESISDNEKVELSRMVAEVLPDALAGLPETANDAVFALLTQGYLHVRSQNKEAAYAALHCAVELSEQHLGPLHGDTLRVLGVLSFAQGQFGDQAEQLKTAELAMQRARSAFADQRPNSALTKAENHYARALYANGQPAQAIPLFQQVLQDRRALDADSKVRIPFAIQSLAEALSRVGRVSEALALMREAVALEARLNPQDSPVRAELRSELLGLLLQARRVDEAQALRQQLAASAFRMDAGTGAAALAGELALVQLRTLQGDARGADKTARTLLAHAGSHGAQLQGEALVAAAQNQRLQGKPVEALALARRAVAHAQAATFELPVRAAAATQLGRAWLELGDYAQAETALRHAVTLFEQAQVDRSVLMADALVGLARVHLHAGQNTQALALLKPLAQAWADANPASDWHGEVLYWLAQAEVQQGAAPPQAGRDHAAALAMLKKSRLPALRQLAADTYGLSGQTVLAVNTP